MAEILEDHGFDASYQKDLVNAHIGGYEQRLMERALEVVGYLLVHTRQLDMIMTGGASVEKYKTKMTTDLKEMGSREGRR